MGRVTSIGWTKSTLNLAWGCSKVTIECENCYMFRMSKNLGPRLDPAKVQVLGESTHGRLTPFYHQYVSNRIAELQDLIFVNSMSDTFHTHIPDQVRDAWFGAFRKFPKKTFQILTKRPAKMLEYFANRKVPPNVWLGTSCGIKMALPRLNILRKIEAPVRFVSFEPLLEDLGEFDFRGIEWGIIGGETDKKKPRPMEEAWVINLMRQLQRDRVKIFFKQWGGIGGDGAGGCQIGGREIKEMPGAWGFNEQLTEPSAPAPVVQDGAL